MGTEGTNIKRDSAFNNVLFMKNLKKAHDWFYNPLQSPCLLSRGNDTVNISRISRGPGDRGAGIAQSV
jgi:hypothetical protein